MAEHTRHDAWQAGEAYDAYMGRWSRRIAPLFLDLLDPAPRADWLELGCGTGGLTGAIVDRCDPRHVTALEPSEGFLRTARERISAERATFVAGTAERLATLPAAAFDLAVSGLVLNFVPDRLAALGEMRRVTRPGGAVAFYVWDYPGGGVGFMRAFWTAAAALDKGAGDLTEDRRFPFCTRDGLLDLARAAGLTSPSVAPLEAASVFADFDDYWHPFTLGTGPAPGYCASLPDEARARLRQRLYDTLPREQDGSIRLGLRAWAAVSRAG
ncbi:class I SAM-dependent methyltransferase [Oceaniglobus roseus]|uniref:class I SAM-dependent methyltransferase n=1 Tax=Oceaniglobus roseus TaxID=1737570 RepID=UPI000C7F56C6|nr:class I SAM-dependent methyltransferase [Kandeliimicrobium roseum]